MNNAEEMGEKLVDDEQHVTSRGQEAYVVILMLFLVTVIVTDFGLVIYLCSFM